MRDVADQAQDVIDAMTKAAIHNIKANAQSGLKPTGVCYSPLCGSEVEGAKLFCDVQCSQDYEKVKKARANSGR